MNIRRVLAVAAIPFLIGTFGFVSQANAEPNSNQIASEPPRPHDRPQRPDDRQDKQPKPPAPHHQKKRPDHPPHQKKRPGQPRNQEKRPPHPPHPENRPDQLRNERGDRDRVEPNRRP